MVSGRFLGEGVLKKNKKIRGPGEVIQKVISEVEQVVTF